MTVLHYYHCCVNWPTADVPQLCAMIDTARPIARRTFLRHVDRAEVTDFEQGHGYDTGHERGGLRMRDDWAVRYYRAKLAGQRVYYINHSGIEYVWR
jgi:hypothetical protein